MPENHYCLDNFFHKVTDMESPRKNNDCYFYYYSTCTKGDSCTFRHEPSALGCETTCSFWKEGKCINVRCNFRHMELRKNRKVIPCYWESQPGGCLKPHCPFLHQNPKHPLLSENQGESSDIKTQDLNKGTAIQNTDSCSKNASQGSEKNFGSPVVDPLVVNFEEESDNESVPTQSPIKLSRIVKVKTLEEIRLERVQAESAAYYSYSESAITPSESADDLRKRIMKRLNIKPEDEKPQDFQVLSLNEIRNKKKRNSLKPEETEEGEEEERPSKRLKPSKSKESDLSQVRIKTLEEIRAERAKKTVDGFKSSVSSTNEIIQDPNVDRASSDSEVSSTSKYDSDIINLPAIDEEVKTHCVAKIQPTKRLKRRLSLDKTEPSKPKIVRLDSLRSSIDENDRVEVLFNKNAPSTNTQKTDLPELLNNGEGQNETEVQKNDDLVIPDGDRNKEGSPSEKLSVNSSKLDEVLLLDEEEFESNDTLKAEEDILKDIDELLNE